MASSNEKVRIRVKSINQYDQNNVLTFVSSGSIQNGGDFLSFNNHQSALENEKSWDILLQVSFPLLIAGLGMVFAGILLDHTQHTTVFQHVTEIYILVPALLGLKGNLEMTMASRLSSVANMGLLQSFTQRLDMFRANIALTQCQSIVVGFVAALFATLINWINTYTFSFTNMAMLCATSILTASIASLILGLIMMFIIVWSLDHKVNPDNIATPIAAALGDLITLYILYNISHFLYESRDTFYWLSSILILISLLLAPFWAKLSAKNHFTQVALKEGWTPVLLAMTISSFGGCILNFAVSTFKGIAVYQPLINGVGGNLAAIQASRISTFLHLTDKKHSNKFKFNLNPTTFLFQHDVHSRTARLLLSFVIPGHLIFLVALHSFHSTHNSLSILFCIFYLSAALFQVLILLYLTQVVICAMCRLNIDPDNSSIPYLTAFGDLFGTLFLFFAFLSLEIVD